jgi:single stranded DNA-binding protein
MLHLGENRTPSGAAGEVQYSNKRKIQGQIRRVAGPYGVAHVLAWERLAEIVGEYVRKGSKIYIEGKLQTSNWQDRQSGEKRYRTEIVARDLVLLGSRDGAEPESEDSNRQRETVHAGSGEITDDIPFEWAWRVPERSSNACT